MFRHVKIMDNERISRSLLSLDLRRKDLLDDMKQDGSSTC
jgi:hypothetical protein